jgi:hypothetical protein
MISQSNGTMENGISKDTDLVTPWEVHAESMTGVNYEKIIGKKLITMMHKNSLLNIIFSSKFSSIWFITFN